MSTAESKGETLPPLLVLLVTVRMSRNDASMQKARTHPFKPLHLGLHLRHPKRKNDPELLPEERPYALCLSKMNWGSLQGEDWHVRHVGPDSAKAFVLVFHTNTSQALKQNGQARKNGLTPFDVHPLRVARVTNITDYLARGGSGFLFAIAFVHEHPGELTIA